MGHTNKKKLEELLDELKDDSGRQDHTSFGSRTFDNSDDPFNDDSLDPEIEREWVPDLNWSPDIRLDHDQTLEDYASEHRSFPHTEVPSSRQRNLLEICKYVPLVKNSWRQYSNEISEKSRLDHGALPLKICTSFLDSRSVPWKISKYKIKKKDSGSTKTIASAVVEFGVPAERSMSDEEVLKQVIRALKQTTDSQNRELNLEKAEFSHEDSGIYYFPLEGRLGGVSFPGVMAYEDLIGHNSSSPVVKWKRLETLKEHDIPETRLSFTSSEIHRSFCGDQPSVASTNSSVSDTSVSENSGDRPNPPEVYDWWEENMDTGNPDPL
jgi:hypothetical protein